MSSSELNVKERQANSAGRDEEGLLSRLVEDVSGLVRSELTLAKSEVNQSVSDVKKGAASLAIGVAILVPGVTLLIAALVMIVEAFTGLEMWSSTLLVGLVITVIGAILLSSAKSKLSVENMVPTRTQSAVKKDADLVERKLS